MKYLLLAIAWIFKCAAFLIIAALFYGLLALMFCASMIWDLKYKEALKVFDIYLKGSKSDGDYMVAYRTPYDLFIGRSVRLKDKDFYSFF